MRISVCCSAFSEDESFIEIDLVNKLQSIVERQRDQIRNLDTSLSDIKSELDEVCNKQFGGVCFGTGTGRRYSFLRTTLPPPVPGSCSTCRNFKQNRSSNGFKFNKIKLNWCILTCFNVLMTYSCYCTYVHCTYELSNEEPLNPIIDHDLPHLWQKATPTRELSIETFHSI